MQISSNFDGGNIQVISASSPDAIQLEIVKDHKSDFYQWFYFRLTGARHADCILAIHNAAGAAYPGGFENYRVLYSYDRQVWRRHPTELSGNSLVIRFTPQQDFVYFAYFAP